MGDKLSSEDIDIIKEYYTWYDTEEELIAHPYSRANEWIRIIICEADLGNKEKVKIKYDLCDKEKNVLATFETTVGNNDDRTIVNVPLVTGSVLGESLNIYFTDENDSTFYGNIVNGYLEEGGYEYVSEAVLNGKKSTVTFGTPLHIERSEKGKVHTLAFSFNGKLSAEQNRDDKNVTIDEFVEYAKENGYIKDSVPVEKSEIVTDEEIKEVADKILEGTTDNKQCVSTKFPVLPVVIVSVGAVCVLIGIILVTKKKKQR